MAKRILTTTFLCASTLSLVITLSHHIPFNIPVLLLFIPLTWIFPELGQSGAAVTYGFAWLEIHALWVWLALFIWHLILVLPVTLLIVTLICRSRRL